MEKFQFKVKKEDGKDIVYDVIATYHNDDSNKDFIIYTDRTFDENNNLKIFYSLYKEIDNDIKLIEITDIDDKRIGLQLIQELVKDMDN